MAQGSSTPAVVLGDEKGEPVTTEAKDGSLRMAVKDDALLAVASRLETKIDTLIELMKEFLR